jgi:hypothetical protein
MAVDQPPGSSRRVFVSWSHAGDAARGLDGTDAAMRADAEWREQVRGLVTALRDHGIDADADIFHTHDIDIDWTRYGPRAVAGADVVLAVVNAAWRDAWDDTGDGTRGRGAVAEIDVIRSRFNDGRDKFQGFLVLVNLPGSQVHRPLGLDRVPRVRVPSFDAAGVSTLLRMLTGQPEDPLPPLGAVPVLPPRGRAEPRTAPLEWVQSDTADSAESMAGTGDAVIDIQVPDGASGALVTVQGNEAQRHFAVRPLGGSALVNTVDAYRGTTFLPLPGTSSTVRLEVKATGRWSVSTSAVDDADNLRHGEPAVGSGDAVLLYNGPGGIAHITGNQARRHFAVLAIPNPASRGRSLVNTVDDYAGSVPCPPGPGAVVVRAVGGWAIDVS